MNNYLLQLLKEIKTIIIPGLGAITLTNEATGEMMFMPYLKYDDGHLATHISEKEGMDLNEARNLIAKFVREVTAELDKGNSYDMYQFGKFKKVDGDVAFEQWNAGNAVAESAPQQESKTIIETPAEVKAAEPEAPIAETVPVVEPAPIPQPAEEPKTAPTEEIITFEAPQKDEKSAPEAIIETAVTSAAIVSALEDDKKATIVPEPAVVKPEPSPKERAAAAEKAKKDAERAKVEAQKAKEKAKKEAERAKIEAQKAKEKAKKEAERAKKEELKKSKSDPNAPKKKRRVLGYVLWGVIVLFLGGATYVAVNFNSLKKDFPLLADLAGDNNDKAVGEKDVHTVLDNDSTAIDENTDDSTDEMTDDMPELNPEEVAPNPLPDEAPVEEPVAENPKPSKPKHSKPSSGNSSSDGAIGSPDPSRPYHVIGGSFGSEANAKRFARELIAKGQPSVVVGEFNGMYRVSVASFATQNEAMQAHTGLKDVVPQSWVFRWP